MLNIRILGLKDLVNNSGELPSRVRTGIAKAIRKSAFAIQASAQSALTTGWTRALDTGRLRADTTVREIGPMRATIYPTVFYAIFVHEGTRFMRRRPFMQVGVENARDTVRDIFKDEVGAAIRLS